MMKFVVIVLAAAFAIVEGTCPANVDALIRTSWNGQPPTGTPPKLVGKILWLTAPAYFEDHRSSDACYLTPVDSIPTSRDVQSNPVMGPFDLIEEEPGVITLSDGVEEDNEKMYIIYFKNNVLAYFQCQVRSDESYPAFAGVAAVNVKSSEIDGVQDDIYAAYAKLKELGLNTLAPLSTYCAH